MSAISSWVTQIVLLILLAMILEMLLPNESFQRYVKLVIGLVIIVALLNPIVKLFHLEPDQILQEFSLNQNNDPIKNSININKTDIEDSQRAYIVKQMAVQMKKLVKGELSDRYDLAIQDMNIKLDPAQSNNHEPINKVTVILGQAPAQKNQSGVKPVAAVHISVGNDETDTPEQQGRRKASKQVIQFLSDKWQIPTSKLSVFMEGGDN